MKDAVNFLPGENIFIHDVDGHRILLDTNDLHMSIHMLENRIWEPHVREVIYESLRGGGGGDVDVGSNIGLHAVYASGLVGRERKVFVIEPNHSVFEILKSNMDINGFLQSTVFFEGAVSNYNGDGTMFIYEGHAGGSGLGKEPAYMRKAQEQHVDVKTLDNLVGNERIDVLKIDVEGFELNVLKGSNKILNNNQDNITIIMEWQPDDMMARVEKSAPEQILDMMDGYGFKCYQANFMKKLKRLNLESKSEWLNIRADLVFTKKNHLDKLCVEDLKQEEAIVISHDFDTEIKVLNKELEFSKQAFRDAVEVQEDLKKQIIDLNNQIDFSKQAFLDAVVIQEQLKKRYNQPTIKEAIHFLKNCVFHKE